MATPYYLIDFENLQPALDRLTPGQCRVIVFTGETTKRVDVDLAFALPRLAPDIRRIAISGSGKNALDFHIAYYIGRLALEEPGVEFRIISRDTGFDPLVRHLNASGVRCKRLPDIPKPPAVTNRAPSAALQQKPAPAAIPPTSGQVKNSTAAPSPRPPAPLARSQMQADAGAGVQDTSRSAAARSATTVQWVQLVMTRLKKANRPNTLAGLAACIRLWIKPLEDEAVVNAVIESMRTTEKITVKGEQVTYAAP